MGKISDVNDTITVDNRFNTLSETEIINDREDKEEIKPHECDETDNNTRKRQLDKTPPNSTKSNSKKKTTPQMSPKAKIQKQDTKSNIPLSPKVTIIPLGI